MSSGENIKRLREAHGMTQAQIAEIAGVTDKAVSTWENGVKEPRMGAIRRIAAYFGVKNSDIVDDADILEKKKAAPETPGAEKQLLEIFRQLDEEGQRLAIGMMKTLLTEHAQKNHTDVVNEVTA